MSIRIVTHCYAEEHAFFAELLRYQCSSLILNKCRVPVTLEVCCTQTDERTLDVLDEYGPRLEDRLSIRIMEPGRLWRRAIGRNEAALASHEDLIWFADADYFFGEDALNTLWRYWCRRHDESEARIFYPSLVWISKDHNTGDETIAKGFKWALPDISRNDFVLQRYSRAIGGAQIIRGTDARVHGYLKDKKKWLQPHATPFPDTRDDIAARGLYSKLGPQVALDLPAVYRIRHSVSSYR